MEAIFVIVWTVTNSKTVPVKTSTNAKVKIYSIAQKRIEASVTISTAVTNASATPGRSSTTENVGQGSAKLYPYQPHV